MHFPYRGRKCGGGIGHNKRKPPQARIKTETESGSCCKAGSRFFMVSLDKLSDCLYNYR